MDNPAIEGKVEREYYSERDKVMKTRVLFGEIHGSTPITGGTCFINLGFLNLLSGPEVYVKTMHDGL